MPVFKRKRSSSSGDAAQGVDETEGSSSLSESDSSDSDSYYSDSDLGSDRTSDSSDASSSSATAAGVRGPVSNLSFNQVLWGEEESASENCFQQNGKSQARVKKAMAAKCCARKCKQRLRFQNVMTVVASFWSLQKLSQDALLWSLQHPVWAPPKDEMDEDSSSTSGSQVKESIRWYLEGLVLTPHVNGSSLCLFCFESVTSAVGQVCLSAAWHSYS